MSLLVRRPMSRALYNFDRMFEDTWNEFRTANAGLPLDVTENDNAFVVSADLPGVGAEDVEIKLHDNVLTVSGETKFEADEENSKYVIRERRYGQFSRSLRFRSEINADDVDANFDNGVLTITVPKAEAAQPRMIAVNATNGN